MLGLLVALKVLRTEGARLAARLEREAALSASVIHPNVIALHDMGLTPEGLPYLAFPLASDGSMLDHSAQPMPWPMLKEQLIGLLDALGALHARGLLHLDVKLSNLLLHRTGARRRTLWLADLGVARARFSEEDDGGLVLGTIGYMAPERLTGQSMLWGPPTDLFSVGAVLYRLISGELPFPAKDPVEALASRQRLPTSVPPRPGMVVPEGLDEIVLNLLEPDRRSRYDLAADVVRALHALPPVVEENSSLSTMTGSQVQPMALLHQVGEDSLIEWPPAPRATRPSRAPPAERRGGIVWHKPAPLRPPRERPRPFQPRRVPQDPRLVVHRELPVIGRDAELDRLWTAARAVLRHRGPALVVIEGERGLGKTRLVDEMVRTWERMGIAQGVRLGYAGQAGDALGLDGAIRALLPPLADPRATRNDIARTLSRLRDTAPASCRYDAGALAEFLNPRPASEAADRSGVRSFLVEHLVAHAWRGFSWLWLDDLHLAGDADDAWPLMEALFACGAPVLMIAGVDLDPRHQYDLRPLRKLLSRHARRTLQLRLDPLPTDQAERLAQAHLPMAPELARLLAEVSRGHPRFLHELIVDQVQSGALRQAPRVPDQEPTWVRGADAPPLPTDARDFARSRLRRMAEEDPDMLRALRVVRLAGSGTPDRVLHRAAGDAIHRLVARGLLAARGPSLTIASPELKAAIVEELSDEASRALHERLATAWQEEGEEALAQGRAGLHLAMSGRASEGLPLLRAALKSLAGTLRPAQLDRLAQQVMVFAEQHLGPGSATWAEAGLARSEALWAMGAIREALQVDESLARSSLEPALAVQAACLHAIHLGASSLQGGGLERLDRVEPHLPQVPSPVRAALHATRARLLAQAGQAEAASAQIDLALRFAPRPPVLTRLLLLRAELLVEADPSAASATARQVQSLARQHGLLQAEVEAWDLLGQLALVEGRAEEAVAELEAGIIRLRRVGEREASGQLLTTLGGLLREAGDRAGARKAYLEAIQLESTGHEPYARAARAGLALLAGQARDGGSLEALVGVMRSTLEPTEASFWSLMGALARLLNGDDVRVSPKLLGFPARNSRELRRAQELVREELERRAAAGPHTEEGA